MPEVTIRVLEVDHNCRPTKKGDPQIGVKYDKGWLKISGGPVKDVNAGDSLLISEPSQFGKSWYARLSNIVREARERANGAAPAAVESGKVTLDDILTVIDRVIGHLPKQWEESPQGCRACAQVINTVIMGVESGQIGLEEAEPDFEEVPPPEDESGPPWERG